MCCRTPRTDSRSGQAAVESAIVLPLAVFIILGLLQMGMMQQGRLFADYAAYRGARVASLELSGDVVAGCSQVTRAELAALTPTIGRADDRANWIKTYREAVANQNSPLPLTITYWEIANAPNPSVRGIDEPVALEEEVPHVHLRLYYLYELRIPFVSWVIGRFYLAQYDAAAKLDPNASDPIHPVTGAENPVLRSITGAEAATVEFWTERYFNRGRYVVPLYASWTMPVFSRPNPAATLVSGRNPCMKVTP